MKNDMSVDEGYRKKGGSPDKEDDAQQEIANLHEEYSI